MRRVSKGTCLLTKCLWIKYARSKTACILINVYVNCVQLFDTEMLNFFVNVNCALS